MHPSLFLRALSSLSVSFFLLSLWVFRLRILETLLSSFAFCFAPNLRPIIATEEAISNLNETPSCSRSPTPGRSTGDAGLAFQRARVARTGRGGRVRWKLFSIVANGYPVVTSVAPRPLTRNYQYSRQDYDAKHPATIYAQLDTSLHQNYPCDRTLQVPSPWNFLQNCRKNHSNEIQVLCKIAKLSEHLN